MATSAVLRRIALRAVLTIFKVFPGSAPYGVVERRQCERRLPESEAIVYANVVQPSKAQNNQSTSAAVL